MFNILLLLWLTSFVPWVNSQITNSFPHSYPGIPNENYIYNSSNFQKWQEYYHVNTASLPNATQCKMPSSYAGNIPVNRAGHPNDTLFFWALESSPGSLTNDSSNDPWMIWLNGGPGVSSLAGLFFEHGPCRISDNLSFVANPFSIHLLADVFYLDQPVGTGFSTADENGYVNDEDQVSEDFMGFLTNLVQIFPSLKTRPLYLLGEDYAGTYIPYITKRYFGMTNPPVKLKHFAIGGGIIGTAEEYADTTMVAVLETYPQLIGYDIEVYKYFREQTHLCGYDLNLTFPQTEPLPSLRPAFFGDGTVIPSRISKQKNIDILRKALKTHNALYVDTLSKRNMEAARKQEFQAAVSSLKASASSSPSVFRRDLSGRPNGTIDPFYQCDLVSEVVDYATNFSAPWNTGGIIEFDFGYIPDGLSPKTPQTASVFLNDMQTVTAIHAPESQIWAELIIYPFGSQLHAADDFPGDPSPAPAVFLSELATNSSKSGVSWSFFSGQADFSIASMGTIATIQNTSFGGIQGFTKPPQTAWYGKDGQVAGIVHQERNVSFLLFKGTGELLAQWQPEHYQTAIREFVLGSNLNGSIDASGNLIGNPLALSHAFNIPAESDAIFTGSGTTQGSTVWPSATIASWNSAIAPFITSLPNSGPKSQRNNGSPTRPLSLLSTSLLCLLTGRLLALTF